jgi:hypothetical protein
LTLNLDGFYAADYSGGDASKGEGGEALTVVDKVHILSCLLSDCSIKNVSILNVLNVEYSPSN